MKFVRQFIFTANRKQLVSAHLSDRKNELTPIFFHPASRWQPDRLSAPSALTGTQLSGPSPTAAGETSAPPGNNLVSETIGVDYTHFTAKMN